MNRQLDTLLALGLTAAVGLWYLSARAREQKAREAQQAAQAEADRAEIAAQASAE